METGQGVGTGAETGQGVGTGAGHGGITLFYRHSFLVYEVKWVRTKETVECSACH